MRGLPHHLRGELMPEFGDVWVSGFLVLWRCVTVRGLPWDLCGSFTSLNALITKDDLFSDSPGCQR